MVHLHERNSNLASKLGVLGKAYRLPSAELTPASAPPSKGQPHSNPSRGAVRLCSYTLVHGDDDDDGDDGD
eukprot:1449932-Alexandrium_andersonii.AAC.1